MLTANARKRTGPAARGAFTLIELLVVIALVAVLAALAAGTVVRVIDTQTRSNTQTTLTKLQSTLNRQWATYKDQFFKEDAARGNPGPWSYVFQMAGNDTARARVLWVKLRLSQAFPMTFREALGGTILPAFTGPSGPVAATVLPPLPAYVNGLTAAGINAANTGTCQSAACLLLALQQSPSGGGVKMEDLGVSSSIQICFTDPDPVTKAPKPVNALVDGYGTPLQFSRWPTGNALVLSNDPTFGLPGLANDPTDPQGLLANTTWQKAYPTAIAAFQLAFHKLPTVNAANPAPRSYALVPLLASAGSDKLMGLDPVTMAIVTSDANDDLYSKQ
jgi:prepilin-type N-terminal cleavage/methylation domain-containing protein